MPFPLTALAPLPRRLPWIRESDSWGFALPAFLGVCPVLVNYLYNTHLQCYTLVYACATDQIL